VILYGHGAASHDQGAAVGYVSSMFAIGLPAFSIFYVLLRTYYAQENTKTPFMYNLGFNLLHMGIGLTLFYTVSPQYRVPSLAVGYSLGYIIICAFTWTRVAKRLPQMQSAKLVRLLARVTVAVSIPALLGWVLSGWLIASNTTVDALKQMILFATVLAVGYLLLAKIMRIHEITGMVAQLVRRRQSKD
jgi:putative peptidoglycan lipid II flippase